MRKKLLPPNLSAGSCTCRDLPGPRPGCSLLPPPSCALSCCTLTTKIAMTMMEEEGGGTSVMMVAADVNGRHGGHHPNHRRWQLKVILPSPALPPSHDYGGSRGAQKPVRQVPLPMPPCRQDVRRLGWRHPMGGRRRQRQRQRRQWHRQCWCRQPPAATNAAACNQPVWHRIVPHPRLPWDRGV